MAKRDTDLDAIYKHVHNMGAKALTPNQTQTLQRYRHAWSLLLSLKSRQEAAREVATRFLVSERTAYQDIKRAETVYGDARAANKAALRAVLTENLLKMLRRADDNDDFEAAAKLARRIESLNGLDKEDTEPPAPRPPVTISFTADPAALAKAAKALESGVGDAKP